jgi:hypothetical protein
MGHIKKCRAAAPAGAVRKRMPSLASIARQAAKAGIPVAGYEVRPGVIKIITGKPGDATGDAETNPWDKVLRNDPADKKRTPY